MTQDEAETCWTSKGEYEVISLGQKFITTWA